MICRGFQGTRRLLLVVGLLSAAASSGCSVNQGGLGGLSGSGGGGLGNPLPDAGLAAGGSGGAPGTIGTGGGMVVGGSAGDSGGAGTGGDTGAAGDTGGAGPFFTGGAPGAGGATSAGAGGSDPGAGGATGVATCDATSCPDGCCDGTICVTTKRTDRRCGAGGVACAACPSCFTCSTVGTCDLVPASDWTVRCDSASVTPTDMGMPWSFSPSGNGNGPGNGPGPGNGNGNGNGNGPPASLPNAFCQLRLNRALAGESSVETTLTPDWKGAGNPAMVTTTAQALVNGRWSVFVGDGTSGLMIDSASICEETLMPGAAEFASGVIDFTNVSSCLSLNLELVCAD